MDAQTLAELTAWIDAYAAATDDVTADLVAAVLAAQAGVNPYSPSEVAAVAEESAEQSELATVLAASIAAQYMSATLGTITDAPVPVPKPSLILLRGGADMTRVYSRPAKKYRIDVSKGVEPAEAWKRAQAYLAQIADGDIRLAQRQALNDSMRELGVTRYRRIVRPELSKTGSCGLCIAASDAVYKTSVLMPIHARCKCTVAPIVGALDPGSSLNNLELGDLYDAAGDTSAARLKNTRYEVNEHGEWGPVLTRSGDNFTGPQDLAPAA